MVLTDYHAKYFAHELTKRCASDSMEKLAGAFVDAQVDLNPHQVEAALFAFKSPLSKGEAYADWLQRHRGTDRVTSSRTADMRSALVDYFREQGQIMIATEAGAEGINLQFCALVVNYDLPWNAVFFEEEAAKLDSWADDLKVALEREIKEMDRQIRALEAQRNNKRRALFDA